MSLTYGELELLICLHFPMAETRRACYFDVASSPFKWPGGALIWPHGTLKKSSWKELLEPIECSDVLVEWVNSFLE